MPNLFIIYIFDGC